MLVIKSIMSNRDKQTICWMTWLSIRHTNKHKISMTLPLNNIFEDKKGMTRIQ